MKNIILFITTILILNSCTKDNEIIAIPSSPTSLICLKVSTTKVDLHWTDNATNENGYKLERKSVSGSYINIGSTGVNATTFSDSGLTPFATYTYRVYAYNKAGNSLLYSNEVTVTLFEYLPDSLTYGLVAYYPFNGNANDVSGNGNNGLILGGVSNTTDRFGVSNTAFLFNGLNGQISISSLDSLSYKPITYSAWVLVNSYLPSSSGHKFKSIVGRNTAFISENGVIGLYADKSVNAGNYDNTFLMWRGGGNSGAVPYSPTIPTLNTWIHILYTQESNGDWKWYQNGILTNSGNFTNTQNDFNHFQIGSCNNQSVGNTFWSGKLDDIGIWNRALSQSEVTYLATH